jgi:hypothetical protein
MLNPSCNLFSASSITTLSVLSLVIVAAGSSAVGDCAAGRGLLGEESGT